VNSLTEDIIQMAMNIPMSKLKELDQIIHEKNQHVKSFQFENAAESREKEKKILSKLGIPGSIRCDNLYSIIRERKIDELLDGN
jgi:pimeloyl-CoA synthetase